MRCSIGATGVDVGPTIVRNHLTSKRITVANIKSQKKRNLTNAKAHERNKAVRSELKSRVKSAATSGDDEAVRMAIKKIDMAAQKGVIHKNAAARKKSRLVKKVAAGA
jgi:small subunit ribosomal protein S20